MRGQPLSCPAASPATCWTVGQTHSPGSGSSQAADTACVCVSLHTVQSNLSLLGAHLPAGSAPGTTWPKASRPLVFGPVPASPAGPLFSCSVIPAMPSLIFICGFCKASCGMQIILVCLQACAEEELPGAPSFFPGDSSSFWRWHRPATLRCEGLGLCRSIFFCNRAPDHETGECV